MTVNVGYSIADISAIKSLPTSLLVNGYARLCRSTNAWFSYDPTSTVTADDISVLLPSSGTGRWLKLSANQNIVATGDATGTGSTSIALTLANSGVTAGSYTNANVTVDSKGRVVSAVNGGGFSSITGYKRLSTNLSVPLVFYYDDSRATVSDYVSNQNLTVVGTEPKRSLVDNTSGLSFLGGSFGHFTIPTSTSLEITGNVSYFAIMKTGTIPSSNSNNLQGILCKQTDSANGLTLNINSSNFMGEFTNSSGTTFTINSSVTLTSNTNYFVAIYRSGANCYINVNGIIDTISTFTGTGIVQSNSLRLGNKVSSIFGFQGIIKMAGITNGILSTGDLTYLNSINQATFPYDSASSSLGAIIGSGLYEFFNLI